VSSTPVHRCGLPIQEIAQPLAVRAEGRVTDPDSGNTGGVANGSRPHERFEENEMTDIATAATQVPDAGPTGEHDGRNEDTRRSASRLGGRSSMEGHGITVIADVVVEKIAGIAARQVRGVHQMGGRTGSAIGALKEIVTSSPAVSQGVHVEVGETEAAIDLDLVAEYGVPIVGLAEAVRRNVIDQVATMTGLRVVEVNVTVHDVHLPDLETPSEPRVQ
jgi:uncharacterized alkaline shock family protein YloU